MNIDYQNDIIAKIDYITISDDCMKSFPCQHDCTLKLTDGREVKVTLRRSYIGVLITSIEPNKIRCDLGDGHFFKPVYGSMRGTTNDFHEKLYNAIHK